MIGAVGFSYGEKLHRIYETGTYGAIDWSMGHRCPERPDLVAWDLKPGAQLTSHVRIEKGLGDDYVLRLVETKRYTLTFPEGEQPHLRNEGNKFLQVERDREYLTFRFINYLGRAAILLPGGEKLRFEVVPDKISYEDDYIGLTEAIARECSQLLMDYTGATSSDFSRQEERGKTLLEQFIFLRQFCFGDNLPGVFASIRRHPDKVLREEQTFRPLGYGVPSKKFYRKPFTYGKGWLPMAAGGTGRKALPRSVAVVHKYDSLDTPANRFVKYALEGFHTICEELILALDGAQGGKQAACLEEARIIRNMLEDIFHDSFFEEVGPLDHMPQNNPVLLKREGYSEVFRAYAMMDMALQLDWQGKDEVYEGEARNVALLYEYWLFFELRRVLASLPGCVAVTQGDKPFISVEDDRLTVNLKQGRESCQSYRLPDRHMDINLYYNRTFGYEEFRGTRYEGSYSRPFRPDYTIAVYPDRFEGGRDNGESEAIRAGLVSYIHFDAKYRITDLTAFMKQDERTEAQELAEDKADEVVNTYKRGDLLKMHTYNDAIRRTIGSYVLYPGEGHRTENPQTYSMYDEIIPGVGAFAIKPGNNEQGEQELAEFLKKLIRVKAEQDSRLNRLKYYNEMIIREPGTVQAGMAAEQAASGAESFVMGFIRKGYYEFLQADGRLETGGEFLFYFYAIKGSYVYAHHKDVFQTKGFRFYRNNPRKDQAYVLEPIACEIESNALVSRQDLTAMLADTGYVTTEQSHSADFYYVLRVKVTGSAPAQRLSREVVESQNGNDAVSPHSPKVVGE